MSTSATSLSPSLLAKEIQDFRDLCAKRYQFNNLFDVALSVAGIGLGVTIVAAGTYKNSELGAILGAVVTAIVSAQRAFPFTQRAQFYRSLIGQAENLKSSLDYNLITATDAVKVLETLRLDFAQQLPRGTTSDAPKNPPTQPQPPSSLTPASSPTAPKGAATQPATPPGGSTTAPPKS
jgi:hypothetical protein